MTAPDTADLIERLNRVESSRKFGVTTAATTNWHRNPDGPEAAKAIEALLSAAREGEKDKARLRVAVEALTKINGYAVHDDDCDAVKYVTARGCSCGYTEASRQALATIEGEGGNRPRPKLWPSNPKGPPPRTAFPAAATPDHIGNSTTMVPSLGVEGVAKLIAVVDALGQELAPDQGERGSHAFGLAVRARAIIAAMEKNDA